MNIVTPAFILDEEVLVSNCEDWRMRCLLPGVRQLFPLKCNSEIHTLEALLNLVDGFSASSLFEAKIAREVGGSEKLVHFTSPGLRPDEIDELDALVDHIAANSLSQLAFLKSRRGGGQASIGLRINPQISFIADRRYDPSGPNSKLGVPIEEIERALISTPSLFDGVRGIHFHNNCDSENWNPIFSTVNALIARVPSLLQRCDWINLGGGYLLRGDTDVSPFSRSVRILQEQFDLNLFVEPGAAIVRHAGVLVSSVIDIFESGGMTVAVLDTSVNHIPETFEYQSSPDVLGDAEDGEFSYKLVGSSCLAGDIFGEYAFATPLAIGSKVTFLDVGAYAAVKSHMFNGINLPASYSKLPSGALVLKNTSNYSDFRRKCGLGEK